MVPEGTGKSRKVQTKRTDRDESEPALKSAGIQRSEKLAYVEDRPTVLNCNWTQRGQPVSGLHS